MSSKSRKTRGEHQQKQESGTPVTPPKVRGVASGKTEFTSTKGALSKRLAKQALPLRRGQRWGTKQGRGPTDATN